MGRFLDNGLGARMVNGIWQADWFVAAEGELAGSTSFVQVECVFRSSPPPVPIAKKPPLPIELGQAFRRWWSTPESDKTHLPPFFGDQVQRLD